MARARKVARYFSPRAGAYLTLAHTVSRRHYTFSETFIHDWAIYAPQGFKEGKTYPCRYDPENPGNGTIRREVDFDSTGGANVFASGLLALLLGWFIPEGVKLAAQISEMRRSS